MRTHAVFASPAHIALCLLFVSSVGVPLSSTYVCFLVGIVLGVSDAVFPTRFWEVSSRDAFANANCKLVQDGSTAAAFLLNDTIGFNRK